MTGPPANNYLYRGEQYDSDLGLYYLRARYYNPLTGRFMSRDPEEGTPYDPKTLHKYLYAGGDPVNAKDPTGREAQEEYKFLTSEVEVGTTEFVTRIAIWEVRTICYAVTALNVAVYVGSGLKQFGPKGWPNEWKAFCAVVSLGGGPPGFPKSPY